MTRHVNKRSSGRGGRPSSAGASASERESREGSAAPGQDYDTSVRQLEMYYGIVKRQILNFQSPTTGLFPVVSSEQEIGSVRDSIYSAAALWALCQSFRRMDDDHGRSYILGQSAVKTMRGILECWLRQAGRVEAFKKNQGPQNSLHCKFHLVTGNTLMQDDEYFHLQIDIVSLWLLFLVQMISSDLQIIYTRDEIAFVQNLVYYVERAYRTPDYGMWERGSKYNDGSPEIHASSIGMAKAALEAINGFNLFGARGSAWSVIYVDIDAHNRNRSIFETMLPKESSSKNTDASLLATVSFPAFATHDETLYSATKSKVVRKLRGAYGFKRFLRDGCRTVLEDSTRRFYYDGETKEFEHVECEWPLFYIYMVIDGVFKGVPDQVEEYRQMLSNRLKVDHNGDPIVPMYYYVPQDCVERERRNPGSQLRYGSVEGSPEHIFLWGQSLYLISELLTNRLLSVTELDLLRRYLPSYVRPKAGGRYSAFQSVAPDLVVQVSLIAESMRLKAMMATYGIQTQTPHEIEPVQIWPPSELVRVYENLGVNRKLALKGRPPRPVGALGTAKIYRVFGQTVLCYPLILEVSDFYLSHDMTILIDDIKNDIHFIGKYWRLSGRPTYCILIREDHMRDPKFREFLGLLALLKSGNCSGQKVQLGRLQNMIASSCVEHLDFMDAMDGLELDIQPFAQLVHEYTGFQSLTDIPKIVKYNEPINDFSVFQNKPTSEIVEALEYTTTLYGKSCLLGILLSREGGTFQCGRNSSVEEQLKQVTRQAGALRQWATVRRCSSLLRHMVDSISPYITQVLVNGKQVTVGVVGQEEIVLGKPMTPKEIHEVLYSRVQPADIYQAVLQQEVIVHVGQLMTTSPDLFNGIRNIRVGWILHAVKLYMRMGFVDDPQPLECYSPSELRVFLNRIFKIREWSSDNNLTPYQKRQLEGCLGRVPDNFYQMVWTILKRTREGISVSDCHLPQQPTISNMTMSELNFALLVEKTLNRVARPEYRQIMVELLCVVSTILHRNPELSFEKRVDLDRLLDEALRMFLKDSNHEKSKDMVGFFELPAPVTIGYLARAVVNHMLQGNMGTDLGSEDNRSCIVS